jgi:hypothetical protein
MTKKQFNDFKVKFFLVFIWVGLIIISSYNTQLVKAKMLDPTATSSLGITPSQTPGGRHEVAVPTLEEYKAYIKTIFGNKWKTAFAIFESECNHTRREWPVCVNKWAHENKGEASIGPAQINLWAHNAKVPGETRAQKEVWLSDWRNSIIMAYRIYKENGWESWTAYSSGVYKAKL